MDGRWPYRRLRPTYDGLVLQGEGDLVGGDGAFAEDHPGVSAAGEVDDGRRGGARGGAAIDDERDLVAQLLAHAERRGALGKAGEIGGGGGVGEAETSDHGAGDCGLGDAKGEVAGVRGDAQRQPGAGLDDQSEGAGPEFFREAVEGGVELAGKLVGLGDLGDEERERFMTCAGLDLVDAIDGLKINRVYGQAVEGVSRQSDDVAAVEAGDDLVDERGFGFVGMDTKGFCRQVLLLGRCPSKKARAAKLVRGLAP